MLRITKIVLGYPLTAQAVPIGADWTVMITGGCAPHIGSISTAHWQEGALKLDTLLLPGHRDNVVGDAFAQAIARRTGGTATVTCGIHYDGPSKADLQEIVARSQDLLAELLEQL